MKRISFLFVCFLLAWRLNAFHIVGGEIEFITEEIGLYRLNVIQYFDELQNRNQGPEPQIAVYIYNNRTHEVVHTQQLSLFQYGTVNYTNPECEDDRLVTSKVVWTAYMSLEPEEFAEPAGYYIVWERCCRNEGVKNVINPSGVGMKYATEIPPLWKNGEPFVNSSPQLFEPLRDYACVGQLYYTRFTGVDPDGDSLVYSLAHPLNTSSSNPAPIPQPKPHPLIFFGNDYSLENMIPGDPALSISKRGLLTVNPSETGLFIFSVLVEEFRNGVKIGEVQREFQMFVIDGCLPPDPPQVGVKIPGNPGFQSSVDTLKYNLVDDKCFEFIVKNMTPGETISLRAEGVNFDEDVSEIFEFNTFEVGEGADSLIVQVCAPGCPPTQNKPFILDLIAGDDACPLPQLDTVRLIMEVEPPPNELPKVTTGINTTYLVNEGERFILDLHALDGDEDSMQWILELEGLSHPDYHGFSLIKTADVNGSSTSRLEWNTDCLLYDFSYRQQFRARIAPDDYDECDVPPEDFIEIDFVLDLPGNTTPLITIDGRDEREIEIAPKEQLNFNVVVDDADGDTVLLRLTGTDFNPFAYGASFSGGLGVGQVESPFSWQADCRLLDAENENRFEFLFIADDQDKCDIKNYDTLAYVVNVAIPENESPLIERHSDYILEVNEPISIDLVATDNDPGDWLTLQFYSGYRPPNSPSLDFESVSGQSRVESTLNWTPECDLLDNGEPKRYDMFFIAFDDRCPVVKFDTTIISFEIRETRDRFDEFLPPNAISPNGDSKNEVFSLFGHVDRSKNLPIDNCDDAFEYVSIHNRAGQRVFFSSERDFVWDPKDLAAGVYYYVLRFTTTEYKNFIQVLR
ncbi:MAG: gliding motility-associated C-terminal domain-containing protein [Cyclobacteriaceae bacterium]